MLDPFVRRFIRASLLWLGFGVVLGVWMALSPAAVAYRPAHMHANLLGFVSMMIFGVAYHVIPRFTGHPLHSRRAAAAHVWIANAGLAAMVGGFIVRVHQWRAGSALLAVGGSAAAAGAFLFIYNLWRTLDEPARRPGALPTVERTGTQRPASARAAG
jgi:cbb3-type cytochrome oxidase subunit 1